MPSPYASKPTASFGYWRGAGAEGPQAYGQGSGYGPQHQGIGLFAQGVGPPGQSSGWTPTVTYMLVFVVAEIIAFGILARVLKRVVP
jgi:hypothetical protein